MVERKLPLLHDRPPSEGGHARVRVEPPAPRRKTRSKLLPMTEAAVEELTLDGLMAEARRRAGILKSHKYPSPALDILKHDIKVLTGSSEIPKPGTTFKTFKKEARVMDSLASFLTADSSTIAGMEAVISAREATLMDTFGTKKRFIPYLYKLFNSYAFRRAVDVLGYDSTQLVDVFLQGIEEAPQEELPSLTDDIIEYFEQLEKLDESVSPYSLDVLLEALS